MKKEKKNNKTVDVKTKERFISCDHETLDLQISASVSCLGPGRATSLFVTKREAVLYR